MVGKLKPDCENFKAIRRKQHITFQRATPTLTEMMDARYLNCELSQKQNLEWCSLLQRWSQRAEVREEREKQPKTQWRIHYWVCHETQSGIQSCWDLPKLPASKQKQAATDSAKALDTKCPVWNPTRDSMSSGEIWSGQTRCDTREQGPEARRQWGYAFQEPAEKTCRPTVPGPATDLSKMKAK